MRYSYAQNFEDVLLHRRFADVAAGFYVDVGASAPVAHNVTLNFYQRGWRGLHVEPIPERAQELRWARPRDIVVEAAAAEAEGRAVFHRTAGAGGLSSLTNAYFPPVGPHDIWLLEVRTRRLDDIFAEHGVGEIDFLKIDVEGAEDRALAGLDFRRWRPAVLVIEAVTPTNPPRDNAQSFEPALLASGYAHVYFDGLNRFYIREESPHLKAHFAQPVSVFDALRRYEDLGEPALNRAHPAHEFALRTGKALLRAFAAGALAPEALLRDYAPGLLDAPATPDLARWAVRQFLAREPKPGEAEALAGAQTLRALLEALFAGDEFRTACACAAA
jgi:FkbM family methyltransferase